MVRWPRFQHDGKQRNHRFTSLPGRVTPRPFAATHRLTAGIRSALPPFPSTNNGLTAPGPSHFTNVGEAQVSRGDRNLGEETLDSPSSFPQFRTRLLGQTTMALSMVPFPETGDCLSRVHMRAMHCRVFPVVRYSQGSVYPKSRISVENTTNLDPFRLP